MECERIGERHALACRYKNEVPEGLRRSARRTHFWPRAGYPEAAWETFIGQKAFGWVAVILFLFSATFFLRYAYQNNWIGPVGRVAIGEMFGAGLLLTGLRYQLKGWHRFASMLMSTGIVVIYLATYSAFGFYHLLPQQHAGIFLAILVLESMIAAVFCRSAVIGMVSVIGGLMTPLLMQADHDTYSSFFTYLAVLNLGVVVALCLQRWRAVGLSPSSSWPSYWDWWRELISVSGRSNFVRSKSLFSSGLTRSRTIFRWGNENVEMHTVPEESRSGIAAVVGVSSAWPG